MIPLKREWSNFSVQEWHRLNTLAEKYDQQLKTAYLKTVVQGNQANSLIIRNVITDCVVETGITSAAVYDMVFNPNSPVYRRLIDAMTDRYMGVLDDEKAKAEVKNILPRDLSFSERRSRLDVFGLDGRSAIRVERLRQEGAPASVVRQTRIDLSIQRGNILALTEVNRHINFTLETLWIDNLRISKADEYEAVWFDTSIPSNITSLHELPKRARKEIVTRRDDRVCDYCLPMEGITARLGTDFDTDYGLFMAPPFHPRCRCFMIVSI